MLPKYNGGTRIGQAVSPIPKGKKQRRDGAGLVVHACNAITWEAEVGGFPSSRPAWATYKQTKKKGKQH